MPMQDNDELLVKKLAKYYKLKDLIAILDGDLFNQMLLTASEISHDLGGDYGFFSKFIISYKAWLLSCDPFYAYSRGKNDRILKIPFDKGLSAHSYELHSAGEMTSLETEVQRLHNLIVRRINDVQSLEAFTSSYRRLYPLLPLTEKFYMAGYKAHNS